MLLPSHSPNTTRSCFNGTHAINLCKNPCHSPLTVCGRHQCALACLAFKPEVAHSSPTHSALQPHSLSSQFVDNIIVRLLALPSSQKWPTHHSALQPHSISSQFVEGIIVRLLAFKPEVAHPSLCTSQRAHQPLSTLTSLSLLTVCGRHHRAPACLQARSGPAAGLLGRARVLHKTQGELWTTLPGPASLGVFSFFPGLTLRACFSVKKCLFAS